MADHLLVEVPFPIPPYLRYQLVDGGGEIRDAGGIRGYGDLHRRLHLRAVVEQVGGHVARRRYRTNDERLGLRRVEDLRGIGKLKEEREREGQRDHRSRWCGWSAGGCRRRP